MNFIGWHTLYTMLIKDIFENLCFSVIDLVVRGFFSGANVNPVMNLDKFAIAFEFIAFD